MNFRGINYDKRKGLWRSRIAINKVRYFLGHYRSDIAAAYAYNKKAIALKNPILNKFDLLHEQLEQLLIDDLAKVKPAEYRSQHKGIFWHKRSKGKKDGRWQIEIRTNGRKKSLGSFKTEEQAIYALQNVKIIYSLPE